MTMTKIVEVGCRPQVAIPSHFPQRTDYPLYSMSLSVHASRTQIQLQVQTQIRTTSLLYDFTSTFLDNTNTNAIMPPLSITARVQSQRIQEDARHQLRSIKCAFTYEATIIPILTIPCLCGMDTVRLLMLCLQQENEPGVTRHKIYERMAESCCRNVLDVYVQDLCKSGSNGCNAPRPASLSAQGSTTPTTTSLSLSHHTPIFSAHFLLTALEETRIIFPIFIFSFFLSIKK